MANGGLFGALGRAFGSEGLENFGREVQGIGYGMDPNNALRKEELAMRQAERASQIAQQKAAQQTIQQLAPTLSQRTGIPVETLSGIQDLSQIGTISDLFAPSKFEEQMQTLSQVSQMSPAQQQLYGRLFGKGGTTVNVGGPQLSPFQEKFQQGLGKARSDQVVSLEESTNTQMQKAMAAENALSILESNPDIEFGPQSELSTNMKSFFAPFLTEDQIQNVADYQTLNSQLTQNLFAETEVLKGAITEKELQAAQEVAGTLKGTRQGLQQTLQKNVAVSKLMADYNQRKADAILQLGENYNEKQFNNYYKDLGEQGIRPTLESLLPSTTQTQGGLVLGEDGVYRPR